MNKSAIVALMIALLLTAAPTRAPVNAQGGVVSGTLNYTFSEPNFGASSYSVLYSYPSNATEGSTLNVTMTLEVNSLTGFRLYLIEYSLAVTLFTSSGASVTRGINATSPYLYTGGHWGPIQLSLPIDPGEFKIPPGLSVTGNLSIAMGTEVWWDAPYSFHYPESGSENGGVVTIVGGQQWQPNYYAFGVTVLTGTAAMLAGTYAWDRLRSRTRGLKRVSSPR